MNKTEERLEKLEIGRAYLNSKLDRMEESLIRVEKLIGNHLKHYSLTSIFMNVIQLLGIVISVLGIIHLINK